MPKLYNSQTRKVEELDGDDLQLALQQGTHSYPAGTRVPVVGPDGEEDLNVPSEKVQDALLAGYKVVGPMDQAINAYRKENQGAKGALKVALGQLVDETAFGIPELIMNKTGDPFEVAKKEALKKDHELANNLGGITGFGASLFVGGPLFKAAGEAGALTTKATASLGERIVAQSAGEVSKRTAMQAARGIVGNMASKGAGSAVEGAILTAPHAITEAALGDPDQAAETLLSGIGIGALFGAGGVAAKELYGVGKKSLKAALTVGQDAAAAGAETSKLAARKLAKVITGVDENDILKYANNHERINQVGATYNLEGVKDEIDAGILGLKEKLASAAKNEEMLGLQLEQAYGIEKQRLAQSRAPETLAPEIMGELEAQKSKLGELSDQLFDVNAASNQTIERANLKRVVRDQLEALRPTKGAAVFGEAAKAEETRLKQLISDIDTLPKQLDMVTAKQIIKQMDPDTKWAMGAGEFNEISDRNRKSFRKWMNEHLKKSPEAASILEEMSRRSDVLNRTAKKFGTLEKATSALNSMATGKGALNKQLLEELSVVSEKDFIGQLAEFERAKALVNKAKVQDIRSEILPELSAQHAAAKQTLDDLKLWNDPISRLSEARTQNIIRNQGFKTASIEDRRALEFLGQQTGKNYTQLIDDLNVFNAFGKSSPNGSRRAVLGGSIGAALGGAPGAAVGATAGAAMDYYGGAILKKLIDGTPDVSGLLFAEKQMKRVAEKLDQIPETLKSLSKITPEKGRSASLQAIQRMMGDDSLSKPGSVEARAKALKNFTEKSSQFISNPQGMSAEVSKLIAPLSQGGAPNIAGALGVKYNAAMAYVFSQAPKPPSPPNPFAKQYEWKPSDAQLAAFEQKLQTVYDPFTVFDELKRGTLTKNHIEALKAVYPKMFFKMQERVQKEIMNGVKPVPYNQRVKLSLLLDSPMDTSLSPNAILGYQKTYAQGASGQAVDKNNMKDVQIANDMQSDVNKLMG